MWAKKLVSFVLSILAPGCVSSVALDAEYPEPVKPILVMHGETSFSTEERAFVEKAAKTWEKQTSGQAIVNIVWDYDQSKSSGDWHTITKRAEDDVFVVLSDCMFSEAMEWPAGEGVCIPAVLAWVGPEDATGIGIHNVEKEPVTLNLIPARYDSAGRWQSVLIHEFGHVFGVAHNTKDQHAVMWPSNNVGKTCLKQPDLVAFCSVNVCDGRKMHPCE